MNMDRKGFLVGALAAAGLAGCASGKGRAAKVRGDKLYGALLHLGANMWSDSRTRGSLLRSGVSRIPTI